MKKCSKCDHVAENIGLLNKHAREVGHPRPKRKKKAVVEVPAPVPGDREREFLNEASDLFDTELGNEALDQAAYDRVLAYLVARYGSQAEAA